MKIAVYCTGFLRTFKTHIQALKDSLGKFDIDFYFYVVSNEYECDTYINSSTNIDTILKECNPKLSIIEKENSVQTIPNRIKSMWYKLKIIDQMRQNIEQKENIKYDFILKIRPDILLITNLEDMIYSVECITVPKINNISYPLYSLDSYEGINDQLAFGTPYLMSIYCRLYDSIISLEEKGIMNSSSMLKAYLLQNNIIIKEVDINYKLLCKENKVITIAGNSGSGKSTFAIGLKRKLETEGEKVLIFECDRYHKWERGNENWKQYTHLHPEANHLKHCDIDVLQLKGNNEIVQRDYDHNNGKFTSATSIEPCPIIIVIGLHTLYSDTLNRISDCKIFLNPSLDLQTEWKINRDKIERGYTADQVIEQINKRYPYYVEYIEPQIKNADIVINYNTKSEIIINKKDEILKYNDIDNVINEVLKIVK